MHDPNNENTVPMNPQRGVEETAPNSVRRDAYPEGPGLEATQPSFVRPEPVIPPPYNPPPTKAAKADRPRRWPWVLLGLLIVILLGAVGTWLGYGSAVQLRKARLDEQRVSIATEHFMLGLVAQEKKQFEIARQQFEHVIRVDPTFPGAQDKLREVMIEMAVVNTPTPAPTEVIPTLTPTPDTRPQDQIFATAKQQYANKEWDALFQTIDTLRKADPAFHAVEIDGMLYTAFRFRGIDKIIHQANLEGGLYDLAMAERFAPLDVDSLGYRNWARLYLNGASFWEVDWIKVMQYFEQIYPFFPNMSDSSGMTASERYRLAARGEGDKYYEKMDYCGSLEFYEKSLAAAPDPTVQQRYDEAYLMCFPPTATVDLSTLTPTPTIEGVLPTSEVTPAITETPTPTETITPESTTGG